MKRVKILLLIIALCITSIPFGAFAQWNGECNTAWFDSNNSEFHISTVAELMGLRRIVNSGESDFYNKTVYLDSDIDLEGITWKVGIGYIELGNAATGDLSFNGTFDGNGHIIKNFNYNSNVETDSDSHILLPDSAKHYCHGLFGAIGKSGKVCNLGIEAATVEAGTVALALDGLRVGTITGQNNGKIESCFLFDITLKGGYYGKEWCVQRYAGVSGVSSGEISNCFVKNISFSDVKALISAAIKTGISTNNSGEIHDCYVKNPIYDKSTDYYTWNADGSGQYKITKMFFYDPITLGGGITENVYSDDEYYKNSHDGLRSYNTFQVMTEKMKSKMDSEIENFYVDCVKSTELIEENSKPANGADGVSVSPQISLQFTQELGTNASATSIVIKDKSGKEIPISGILPSEYECKLSLGSVLDWNEKYSVIVDGLTDIWGRTVVPSEMNFTTVSEVSCTAFKLYKNYPLSPVEVTDLTSENGKVTAVITNIKNNGAKPLDAIMSIAYMQNGRLKRGTLKAVRIEDTVDGDTVLEIDLAGLNASEGTKLEAVLYKGIGNVVPLLTSVKVEK